MEHWAPSKLLDFVCTRPKMFAANGDFAEIAAFLDGYSTATNALTSEQGKQSEWAEWSGFRTWLADRCWEADKYARNLGWQSYIRHLYPDSEARLKHLPLLFAEYLEWRAGGGEPSALRAKLLE